MEKEYQQAKKKAKARIQLLRKVSNFTGSYDDLKIIYVSFIRSLLEQACTVWHSGLTDEKRNDLERVQKCALKIIFKNSYKNYQNALNILELESLENRREFLCLQFAKKSLKNPKMKDLFPHNKKTHKMSPRKQQPFEINFATTDRLKKSPVIYMQQLLNENFIEKSKCES